MARPLSNPELERQLLNLIFTSGRNVAARATETFGLSRQAINKHLRDLVRQGTIRATGSTRSRRYELSQMEVNRTFALAGLAEHDVWEEFVRPYFAELRENVRRICQYGVTEMVNNAIDHSEGTSVLIILLLNPVRISINVYDNGVGIFKKIRKAFQLPTESEVMLELSKGKLTTDPARHSGEGIFFTSRIFDQYSLYAGSLFFIHFPDNDDWLLERAEAPITGTWVSMELDPASPKELTEVFDRFAAPEQYHFDVTHVPVKLAQLGEDSIVSRSQAKRLVARFERFSRVVLNFAGVETIGQAFADEVFRVFRREHPRIDLRWINTSEAVERMIQRAIAGGENERAANGGTGGGIGESSPPTGQT
ncbi:MAG: STAS-like domain-containing protein [Gemmatimonadaceae bacterium]